MKPVLASILISAAIVTAGCATSVPSVMEKRMPAYNTTTPLKTVFSIEEIEFDFYSVPSGKPIRAKVSFTLQLSESDREERRARLSRAFDLKSQEGMWLLMYLSRHTLEVLNGGQAPEGMTLSGLQGIDIAQGRPWWIAPKTEEAFVNFRTLSLRGGNEVLSPTGDQPTNSDEWTSLDPAVYDRWYRLLDSRLLIEQLFTGSANAKGK